MAWKGIIRRLALALGGCIAAAGWAGEVSDLYAKRATWPETLAASRRALQAAGLSASGTAEAIKLIWRNFEADFPIPWDWLMQDAGHSFTNWFKSPDGLEMETALFEKVRREMSPDDADIFRAWQRMMKAGVAADDQGWLDLYRQACERRRALRLKTLLAQSPKIIFTKRATVRPSFFAYTEGQSDAQAEAHFLPGSALCLLEMDGLYGTARTLLEDPAGVIRDPALSYDARRLLFAWKKSHREDDYHLYEMELASGKVRQLTFGLGFADYEPAYLPNGDIIFASTRCVQTVDCFWTEVSNLYTCDANGRYLRRLGVDQVHTVFPTVTDDGRVIYTRWDYNDRGQVFPQALFQMNPDGTGQTEFYGNNSWFPTTIAHARNIPGTQKVLAIFCGHHSTQAGKLGILDPALGRQENTGAQLIAPIRETKADRIDAYGQTGELFQYPYPLNEREFLVAYAPLGWNSAERRKGDADFGIYLMDVDGRRELLVSDRRQPCQQPVPLAPRSVPPVRPATVNHRQRSGAFYLQDIHIGPGLAGVALGTIKKLRVVALDFRAAGIGSNGSSGPGGGALISTPIAIGNGSWDVKIVLGEAVVHEDGSAYFEAPARTPVYFQALDERGRAVQTMRSWSTLQPGEIQSCVGCHEHKNTAPPAYSARGSLALRAGLQELTPFYGPARGFSFAREIQPILDRHCVSCHKDRDLLMTGARWKGNESRYAQKPSPSTNAFSLLAASVHDPKAKRYWSDAYLNLTQSSGNRDAWAVGSFRGDCQGPMVNWISSQSVVSLLPPNSGGAVRSELLTLLEKGHYQVRLNREEMEKLACWIDLLVPFGGDYREANAWTDEEKAKYDLYEAKRRRMEEIERQNIRDMLLTHR